ncbi:MAG: nucleotidyltransferase family protein [Lachnospirales bacterium]
MKAIILVAGYATRLYPLTKDMPKSLIEVGGKTILDHIVDEINTLEEVTDIYLISNSKFYNHFLNWSNGKNKKNIEVLDDGTDNEDNRLGAIADMWYTIEQKKIDEDTLVIAGDNLFTYPLKKVKAYFDSKNSDVVCAKEINDVEILKGFAVATLDENDKITDLVEKPKIPKSNIGVYATYFYKKETLPLIKQYLDEGNKGDAPGYFTQWLYEKKEVYAYKFDGQCYDIGTFSALEAVKELYE